MLILIHNCLVRFHLYRLHSVQLLQPSSSFCNIELLPCPSRPPSGWYAKLPCRSAPWRLVHWQLLWQPDWRQPPPGLPCKQLLGPVVSGRDKTLGQMLKATICEFTMRCVNTQQEPFDRHCQRESVAPESLWPRIKHEYPRTSLLFLASLCSIP